MLHIGVSKKKKGCTSQKINKTITSDNAGNGRKLTSNQIPCKCFCFVVVLFALRLKVELCILLHSLVKRRILPRDICSSQPDTLLPLLSTVSSNRKLLTHKAIHRSKGKPVKSTPVYHVSPWGDVARQEALLWYLHNHAPSLVSKTHGPVQKRFS